MSDAKKLCLGCQSELVLAFASFPMGSVFAHEHFHADIYRCPQCGHIALFAAETEELVTCPVCCATHSPKKKHSMCAINSVFADHGS